MSGNKGILSSLDWKLLFPCFVLLVFSLTTLFSIDFAFFKSQLIFLVFSFVIFLFFSQVNYKIAQLYGYPLYIVSIFFLLIVLIIGIESRGAVRWLDLFGFRIQFSEILKPFLAISLATFLDNNPPTFKTFFLSGFFLAPIAFLIFIQPDLGSAMIYMLAVILTLMVAGFPVWWFGTGFVGFIATTPLAWHFLHDYQKQRILTFIHPGNDPLGTSYNAIQAIIAVGSGMVVGKGLSERTQSGLKFLPEHHTDFIFATFSEGLGFLGTVVLLVAFGFLLYRIYEICQTAETRFGQIYAAFAFSLILIQFFINVGMNIGIVPVVGITLPFISYGGSSLLSNFILLGFLSSISSRNSTRQILEIR